MATYLVLAHDAGVQVVLGSNVLRRHLEQVQVQVQVQVLVQVQVQLQVLVLWNRPGPRSQPSGASSWPPWSRRPTGPPAPPACPRPPLLLILRRLATQLVDLQHRHLCNAVQFTAGYV